MLDIGYWMSYRGTGMLDIGYWMSYRRKGLMDTEVYQHPS